MFHRFMVASLLGSVAMPAFSQQPPNQPLGSRVLWADPKTRADGSAGLITVAAAVADSLPANNDTFGDRPYVTLLCKFADFPDIEPATRARAEQLMAGTTYPSLNHYWTEVSGGRFTLNGSKAFGWYTLPRSSTHYVSTFVRFQDLEQDCARAADADVNFQDFVGVNIVVNTNLDGRLYAGGFTLDLDGGPRFYRATYLDNTALTNIGLAMHEVGHTFGLAHTSGGYGFDYDSRWDVMSHPGFHHDPASGVILPAHTNALQKVRLGVIVPARQAFAPVGTTTLWLERAALSIDSAKPAVLVVPIPASYPTFGARAYYSVEVRGGPGSGYDAAHPEQVAVIHKVTSTTGIVVVDIDGNGDPNDAGAQWKTGETFVDRANAISIAFEEQVGTAMRVTVRVTDRNLATIVPESRRRVVPLGDTTTYRDSVSFSIAGPTGASSIWSASAVGRRVVMTNASGIGSGVVRWTSSAAGLGAGSYFTTITMTGDVANSPFHIVDTLVVTPSVDLRVGLAVASANDSTLPDRMTGVRQVTVVPSGPGADTVHWSRTRSASWIQFEPAGRDSNPFFPLSLVWRHNSAGLAPGIYVDTIVVALSNGASVGLVDTLTVLPPLGISLRRSFGSASVIQAGPNVPDSVFVDVTGPWAAQAPVLASYSSGLPVFLQGFPSPRIGSGWVQLRRVPLQTGPGTYVNRAKVRLAMDTLTFAIYEDTLRILPSTPRILLSDSSRSDTIMQGQSLSMDSVFVYPAGDGTSGRIWQTSSNPLKTVLMPRNGTTAYGYGSGNGTGWLVWLRNFAGRAPGVYVDTLRVKFYLGTASPTQLIDTLVILAQPALAIAAASRHSAVMVGSTTVVRDSVTVSSPGTAWTATKSSSWLTLTTASGSGDGKVRWERNPTGLAPGVHVDTIRIAASGLANSPQRIVDTLRVWPLLAILGDSTRRAAVMGAGYADTLRSEGGTGTWTWSRESGELPPGVTLAVATGELRGRPEAAGTFRFVVAVASDTFRVTKSMLVVVTEPTLEAGSVFDHLLLGSGLTADQAHYVDLLGNRNGRLDVGDARAWLTRAATVRAAVDTSLRRSGPDTAARTPR